jgi:hypothetical protein
MSVKKIGKAVLDVKNEVWRLEGGKEGSFLINRRLVDTRPELKQAKSSRDKMLECETPSRRQPNKRKAYFEALEAYQKNQVDALTIIYKDIEVESRSCPVLLRREKDYDHHIDWRYCLYQGVVYQFDRPGYSDEEMLQQIEALEARK